MRLGSVQPVELRERECRRQNEECRRSIPPGLHPPWFMAPGQVHREQDSPHERGHGMRAHARGVPEGSRGSSEFASETPGGGRASSRARPPEAVGRGRAHPGGMPGAVTLDIWHPLRGAYDLARGARRSPPGGGLRLPSGTPPASTVTPPASTGRETRFRLPRRLILCVLLSSVLNPGPVFQHRAPEDTENNRSGQPPFRYLAFQVPWRKIEPRTNDPKICVAHPQERGRGQTG